MLAHDYRKKLVATEGNTYLLNRLNETSDIIKTKTKIKQKLVGCQDIRVLIDDPELRETEDYDEYMYTHIFPYLVVPNTLHTEGNYICFKVDDADDSYYDDIRKDNLVMKVVEVQFMILVHVNQSRTKYGADRHDALAFVIKQLFAWSENVLGYRLRCVSDIEGVTDNNYITRTLTFEGQMTNNTTDTRRKNPYQN